jgi:hypothetical protein
MKDRCDERFFKGIFLNYMTTEVFNYLSRLFACSNNEARFLDELDPCYDGIDNESTTNLPSGPYYLAYTGFGV